MYLFKRRSDLHAILPCMFALTNVFFGVVGFYHAYRTVQQRKYLHAHRLSHRAYGIMFAILGFGYRRFMYPGYAILTLYRHAAHSRSLGPVWTGKTASSMRWSTFSQAKCSALSSRWACCSCRPSFTRR